MKLFYTIILSVFSLGIAMGQQAPQYSLYMFNPYAHNPAYAGLEHSLNITGTVRKQWLGFEGSPLSQNVNVHMPLYYIGGGLGLNLENDLSGAEQLTSASMGYAYHLFLPSGILSFGASGGISQRSLDGTKLITPTGTYSEPGNINHNDDLLPLEKASLIITTFNAGIFYQGERLETGIGVRNLTEPEGTDANLSLILSRSYHFFLRTNFELNRSLKIAPSVNVRSDIVQTQIDFSALATYNDNIIGGVSFRGYSSSTIDALAIITGFNLSENISFAYAYDLSLSKLKNFNNGSHEVMIRYNLNKPIGNGVPPPIIYNPRSL